MHTVAMPRRSILVFVKAPIVFTLFAFALFALALLASPMAAQEGSFHLKVDFSGGFGRTFGGGARDVPAAIAFGAVVAAPLRERANGALVVGLSAHFHWPMDNGTSCIIRPGASECMPSYPKFNSVAALVGWEPAHGGEDARTRVLVGPALFRTDLKRAFRADEKQTLLGLQGRIDFIAMPTKHAGLLLWAQGAAASPLRNERYFMLTGGLGVRLQ